MNYIILTVTRDLVQPRNDPLPRNDPYFSSRRPRNDPQLILGMERYPRTMDRLKCTTLT